MGIDNPTSKWTFVTDSATHRAKRAKISEADTKPCAPVPVITEGWQVDVLMRVPQHMDRLAVNLKPDKGGDEILQKATDALHNLPSTDEFLQWKDSRCKEELRKFSHLWEELGPVVFSLSTYVPTAAEHLWDDLTEPPPPGYEDFDEDFWIVLRRKKNRDVTFSKRYILELLQCVQELCDALSPDWMQRGMWKNIPSEAQREVPTVAMQAEALAAG
ncbi:hypothetical protein COCOBI_03-1640 [Coccomyxa sp. Obi]|nr:hypothetical protein COCOBI_03-1640 [Coccomyxa sp. Obi]